MLRVAKFEKHIGRYYELPVGYLKENLNSRKEAIQLIKIHVQKFELFGPNNEHGYWWCRNEGELTNTILRIEPM